MIHPEDFSQYVYKHPDGFYIYHIGFHGHRPYQVVHKGDRVKFQETHSGTWYSGVVRDDIVDVSDKFSKSILIDIVECDAPK